MNHEYFDWILTCTFSFFFFFLNYTKITFKFICIDFEIYDKNLIFLGFFLFFDNIYVMFGGDPECKVRKNQKYKKKKKIECDGRMCTHSLKHDVYVSNVNICQ